MFVRATDWGTRNDSKSLLIGRQAAHYRGSQEPSGEGTLGAEESKPVYILFIPAMAMQQEPIDWRYLPYLFFRPM